MRRPLALFGAVFLIGMLAAVRLPAVAGFAAAGVLAAAFVLVWLLWKRRRRSGGPAGGGTAVYPALLVGLGAVLLAIGLRAGYDALMVRPVAALAGGEHAVRARVLQTSPGYGEEDVNATLRVLELDSDARSFKVEVQGLPLVAPGDVVELPLRFYPFAGTLQRNNHYGRGCFVGAAPAGEARLAGTSHTLVTRLRLFQYAAGENITGRLPARLGAVAAAMTVGDRRLLGYEATEAYRAGGISHMLVVSGLHLSLLCGMLRGLCGRLRRKRPVAAAVLGMVFVGFFMVFTGLTASIVRAGVMWLFIFLAPVFGRREDSFTALGLAALVLVGANPYTATSVGLLLSLTATAGALLSSGLWRDFLARRQGGAPQPARHGALRRLGRGVGAGAFASLCVTAATLPVLVYAGMGISLLCLPANLLAVPLLGPIVVCGFFMAIPPALPVLGLLGQPAALVCGLLLRFLELLTGWCATQSWSWIPLGGAFGLTVVLVLYAVVWAGHKLKRTKQALAAAAVLAVAVLGLHLGLNTGTVKVTVASSGTNASLVVSSGGQSVVLYRSRLSIGAVQRVLRQNHAQDCVLLIDMRTTTESTEAVERLAPQTMVVAKEDLVAGAVYTPLEDVTVTVVRQGDGTVACVDVAGYKVAAYTGAVNLEGYASPDVLLAGSGKARGEAGTLLSAGALPAWADPAGPVLYADGDALLWIRPGKSVVFREVADGTT